MFHLDSRIQSTCYYLGEWPLSQVLLKNERHYPWFLLVPKRDNIQELYQLTYEDQLLLLQEINELSSLLTNFYQPKKLNIATLGNVVSQLHIHCIVRKEHDPLWPQGIWQSSYTQTPYEDNARDNMLPLLQQLIEQSAKLLEKKDLS